jgi:predicted  nucleic acid-binding Zn-ribbon protein
MRIFGTFFIGWLPTEEQKHQSLLKLLRKIMSTQTEIAAQLVAAAQTIASLTAQITKVGTETDKLLAKIVELENNLPDNVSPQLEAAVDALKLQIQSLQTAAQSTDDKVPDA